MRKIIAAALLLGFASATAGVATAAVAEKCPDGYVGVVVDEHDVCTNILQYIKGGNA